VEGEFRGTSRYEVVECLGRGGMGVVYRALDRDAGSEIAIKVLDDDVPDGVLRFQKEFRSVQAIVHPNLVRLGELVEVDGQWFFTMELVDGIDFLTAVASHGRSTTGDPTRQARLPAPDADTEKFDAAMATQTAVGTKQFNEPRLRRLLPPLVEALDALHSAGKVHRDVKPSNVLVTHDDQLVVLDFGMVSDLDDQDRITGSGVIVGTSAYIAPEQLSSKDRKVSPASDWYAVGVLLYEALTGQLPFEGSALEVMLRKQQVDPIAPSMIAPDVPDDLEALCMSLLHRDPDERPDGRGILALLGVEGSAVITIPPAGDHFVGRELELERVLSTAAELECPKTVVLEGPSGIGKTSLADEIQRRLGVELPHSIVLAGRCYGRESVPFKGFDGVVKGLARWLEANAADVAELPVDAADSLLLAFPGLHRAPQFAGMPRMTPGSADPRELRERVFESLAEIFSHLAREHPVVVRIDDMQWAADDTWALLEALATSAHEPRLLLLLTRRPTKADDHVDRAEVLDPELMRIGPLTADQAAQLARAELRERGGDPELAAVAAAETGGHPLFVTQLAVDLAQRPERSSATSLNDLLRARIASLPVPARRALEVICVSLDPLAQKTAAIAIQVPTAEVLTRWVPMLESLDLVRAHGVHSSDKVEPFHGRVRDVALGGLAARDLAVVHAVLADAFEETGEADANPDLHVRYLLAAGRVSRAARRAVKGGDAAVEGLAFAHAAELYEIALSGGLPADVEADVRAKLAEALVNSGQGALAAEQYMKLADAAPPGSQRRIDYRQRAAEQLAYSGQVVSGMEALGKALDELDEKLPDSELRALSLAAWQRCLLAMPGGRRRKRGASPRELARLELYGAISVGLSAIDHIRATYYMAKYERLASKLGERNHLVRALSVASVAASGQLSVRRARRLADRTRALADELGDPDALAFGEFARAGIRFFLHNDYRGTDEAMRAAEAHLRNAPRRTGWENDTAQAYQCFSRLYLGDFENLDDRVDQLVGEARRRGSQYGVVTLRSRVVLPRLASGQADKARAELHRALDNWLPWNERFLVQHFYALHSECEIALYQGAAERAWALCEEQMPALRRSYLHLVPMVRDELGFARARLALSLAQAASGGERKQWLAKATGLARGLRRSKLTMSPGLGALVDATAAYLAQPDAPTGPEKLGLAVDLLENTQCRLYARVARGALHRTRTNEPPSDRWLGPVPIAERERFAAVVAPGWPV